MVINVPHACFQAMSARGVKLISINFVFVPIYTVFQSWGFHKHSNIKSILRCLQRGKWGTRPRRSTCRVAKWIQNFKKFIIGGGGGGAQFSRLPQAQKTLVTAMDVCMQKATFELRHLFERKNYAAVSIDVTIASCALNSQYHYWWRVLRQHFSHLIMDY
jgi:hypothetical protein